MCTLSDHAFLRMIQRNLTLEQCAAALAGRVIVLHSGCMAHYDRTTHCTLVIDPQRQEVVTAYRMKKKQLKRLYSR